MISIVSVRPVICPFLPTALRLLLLLLLLGSPHCSSKHGAGFHPITHRHHTITSPSNFLAKEQGKCGAHFSSGEFRWCPGLHQSPLCGGTSMDLDCCLCRVEQTFDGICGSQRCSRVPRASSLPHPQLQTTKCTQKILSQIFFYFYHMFSEKRQELTFESTSRKIDKSFLILENVRLAPHTGSLFHGPLVS